MEHKQIPFILFCLILSISILSNCTQPKSIANNEKENPLLTKAEKGLSPEENYATYCSSCHGNKMEAFVDRRWKKGKTKESLVKSIRYGITSSGMPAYDTTFTVVEIEALADYILKGIEKQSVFDETENKTPKYYSTQYLSLIHI